MMDPWVKPGGDGVPTHVMAGLVPKCVIAGLDPAIHLLRKKFFVEE